MSREGESGHTTKVRTSAQVESERPGGWTRRAWSVSCRGVVLYGHEREAGVLMVSLKRVRPGGEREVGGPVR